MTIRKPLGLGLLLGLLALAFAAMPALASAQTFTNGEGEALEVGAPLTANASLTFTNSNGVRLLCAENTLSGEVTNNPPGEALINSATFTGAGGGACATNVPGLTADVTATAGWTLRLTATGHVWHLGENVKFTATLTAGGASVGHCTYERVGSVTGTYTTAAATTLTVGAGQEFAAVAPSTENCGTGGVLEGSTTLSSEGGAVGIS